MSDLLCLPGKERMSVIFFEWPGLYTGSNLPGPQTVGYCEAKRKRKAMMSSTKARSHHLRISHVHINTYKCRL